MDLKSFVSPFPLRTYKQRRQKLLQQLAKKSSSFTAVFWSGSELSRSHDVLFPFRAHSDFLYLTGFSDPHCLLLLQKTEDGVRSAVGVRPRDLSPQRGSEIWEGERLGVERAPRALAVEEAFDIKKADHVLKEWLKQTPILYWSFGVFCEWDQKITQITSILNHENRGIPIIHEIRDTRPILHEMRKVKTLDEIKMMRKSAQIASKGHRQAMAKIRSFQFGHQIAAEVEREFKRGGAQALSYQPIVASGANACTLHYHSANNDRLKKNDLLLMDAGAEFHGYASDITRCFPISGHFTPAQKEIYEWVLRAQLKAIQMIRPGIPFNKPHEEAVKVLSQGLVALGIFKRKDWKTVYKKGLWKKYMPHGTSHWLGLDVHDCGIYHHDPQKKKPVRFQPGNVLTVEPGLYFHKNDKSVPLRFRGIGIRIEDDVLVTPKGYDVLSKDAPKTIKEIEAACGLKL